MSRYSGPYPGRKDPSTRTKGIARETRKQKRLEAEVRNELTPPEKRRCNRGINLDSE